MVDWIWEDEWSFGSNFGFGDDENSNPLIDVKGGASSVIDTVTGIPGKIVGGIGDMMQGFIGGIMELIMSIVMMGIIVSLIVIVGIVLYMIFLEPKMAERKQVRINQLAQTARVATDLAGTFTPQGQAAKAVGGMM